MRTKDYRKQIEQSIAAVVARRPKAIGPQNDPERLRAKVADKKIAAKTRAQTLGRLTQLEGPDVVPQPALERLADPKESPIVRLAAMKLLQQQQIVSSVAAEWKPAFIEALRAALAEPKLRKAALEILSAYKDRQTQEQLLEGLRKPKKALVPADHALRLLSADIHADVLDVARRLATDQQSRKNKKVFLQALRILGSDPASVGRLESVLGNNAQSTDARRLAATALSHLSPESLSGKAGRRAAPGGPKRQDALSKHIATLQSIRE
jgi:hypothetical protein